MNLPGNDDILTEKQRDRAKELILECCELNDLQFHTSISAMIALIADFYYAHDCIEGFFELLTDVDRFYKSQWEGYTNTQPADGTEKD